MHLCPLGLLGLLKMNSPSKVATLQRSCLAGCVTSSIPRRKWCPMATWLREASAKMAEDGLLGTLKARSQDVGGAHGRGDSAQPCGKRQSILSWLPGAHMGALKRTARLMASEGRASMSSSSVAPLGPVLLRCRRPRYTLCTRSMTARTRVTWAAETLPTWRQQRSSAIMTTACVVSPGRGRDKRTTGFNIPVQRTNVNARASNATRGCGRRGRLDRARMHARHCAGRMPL